MEFKCEKNRKFVTPKGKGRGKSEPSYPSLAGIDEGASGRLSSPRIPPSLARARHFLSFAVRSPVNGLLLHSLMNLILWKYEIFHFPFSSPRLSLALRSTHCFSKI